MICGDPFFEILLIFLPMHMGMFKSRTNFFWILKFLKVFSYLLYFFIYIVFALFRVFFKCKVLLLEKYLDSGRIFFNDFFILCRFFYIIVIFSAKTLFQYSVIICSYSLESASCVVRIKLKEKKMLDLWIHTYFRKNFNGQHIFMWCFLPHIYVYYYTIPYCYLSYLP